MIYNCLSCNVFADSHDGGSGRYWIIFDKKPESVPVELSRKSLQRRRDKSAVNYGSRYDLPVNEEYIDLIVKNGATIHRTSRWLNAVSVTADRETLYEISRLPFVQEIRRVSSFALPRDFPLEPGGETTDEAAQFNYGLSYNQISMLGIDSLHHLGFSGAGVLVGIMDTGFDYNHRVFSDIVSENRIISTYDFINGDTDVVDGPDRQRDHGTKVFSVLAGFDEDTLIGPAFGASFVLAKTEIELQEIQAEEDNWVAAAEWMDSLGVDIISSSLGYIDWYDTTDLDGRTALCTQAANIAVSMGIVVVNSAGNEGNTAWRKIIPPADGDSVIAAGGVSPDGVILSLSSRGPTADGRIKPDFCAQGSVVFTADWHGGYGFSSGTSFSAPLIAGGIALLLEAEPGLTVADIIGALKTYSFRAPSFDHIVPQAVLLGETLDLRISVSRLPDNDYGWGIPDFNEAYHRPDRWYGNDFAIEAVRLPLNSTFEDSLNGSALFSFTPDSSQVGEDTALFAMTLDVYSDTESVRITILEHLGGLEAVVAPNPAEGMAKFRILPSELGKGYVSVHDVTGIKVWETQFEATSGNIVDITWDGRNESGKYVASGVYIFNVSMGGSNITGKFFLVSYR